MYFEKWVLTTKKIKKNIKKTRRIYQKVSDVSCYGLCVKL